MRVSDAASLAAASAAAAAAAAAAAVASTGAERRARQGKRVTGLRLAVLASGVVTSLAAGACSFGIDVPALSECAAGECDRESPDAGAPSAEAGGDADALPPEPPADSALVCPEGRGPRMLRVAADPPFCIDETEVTADQYAAFVASKEVPPPARLAAACRTRTTFTPKGAWPPQPGRGTSPVSYVDFCDAQAFCTWSGKRLCGAREGGALDVALMNRAPFDVWFAACGGDRTVYPYADAYGAKTCNGIDQGVGTVVPVGSLAGCRGSTSGALDMSGNLWEWTDTCERDVDVVTDRCFARGGAFNAPSAELTCASRRASTRGEADPTIGFRCCAP
jgi:formylglycine-generating enzyme required for sulfatase activity